MDSANNNNMKNRWVILFVIVMLTFMATLDSSIVNVALPVMAKDLNVTSAGIQVVVTSYLIIISATILVFGRLGDILGKTKVFKFIALSTTLLYNRISHKIGYHVTDYVVGRNDAFIYGMRIVYITAAVICIIGAILIALRLFKNKSKLVNI
jgi:MFS family permease